jgi:hypothetical protein
MANPKLFSEFRSSYGHFYLIEIWDEDYTGNDPEQFNVTGEGFQLNYSGQTDNIYSPIIGSSVSFGMYVQNSATTAFLNNIKQYQQDRYFVKIWKGEFSGEDANTWYNTTKVSDDGLVMSFSPDEEQVVYLDFYWGGYIVQDIIEIEDVSQPYILNIQATDGISKLADTQCGTSFFRQSTNQFINALDQVGVLGIYGSEHPVLAVVCNWWAEEMTYNANNNPMDETWVDFHAFDTIDEQGNYTNKNWFEILSQMCTIFGLRFYYSNGQYRLEQLFQRDSSSMVEHRYKKDKTKIDSASVSYNKTIDQTPNKARLAGNIFNFLPAVNDVAITLNQEEKAITGVTSTETNDPTTQPGVISSALNNQVSIDFQHDARLLVTNNVNQQLLYFKFKLKVTLFDFTNNVTYYLKRTINGTTPGAISWTTTQSGSGYEVLIGHVQEYKTQWVLPTPPPNVPQPQSVKGTISVLTPAIPASGDMSFEWDFVEMINYLGATRTLNASNVVKYSITTTDFRTSFGSIQNQVSRIRAISPSSANNGGLTYTLPETSVFTGQGERGSLVKQYNVGSLLVKIPYTNWREGNFGSYNTIQKLVCQEFLKLMDAPIQKYMGRMFSSHDFRQRLTFDSRNWIQLGGTYSANTDEWDGEWFVISRASISPTFDDVTTITGATGIGSVNGLTGNSSFEGIDAVNADLNSVDVTTNANVDGNTTLGGTLGVTGNSTLSATSVGEFTTTGRVNVTLNEVTGNPGGSETLSAANNFNFIDFASGENGTYTLNLPASEPGLIMRFKTDDTISNSKDISLTPQSGERIDGEASYTMDRPFDGITLMGGPSGDWFVIQKKEK